MMLISQNSEETRQFSRTIKGMYQKSQEKVLESVGTNSTHDFSLPDAKDRNSGMRNLLSKRQLEK